MTSNAGSFDDVITKTTLTTQQSNVETPSTPSTSEGQKTIISSFAKHLFEDLSDSDMDEPVRLHSSTETTALSRSDSSDSISDSSYSIIEQTSPRSRSSTVTIKLPENCAIISEKSTNVAQKNFPETRPNSSSLTKSSRTDSRATHISAYAISISTIDNILKGENVSSKERDATTKLFISSKDEAVNILMDHCNDMVEVNHVLKELKLKETDVVAITTTLRVKNAISERILPNNLLDDILQRFQDPSVKNPPSLNSVEMKLILHHPERGKFLAELFKLDKNIFIKFIQTGVPFNLDNALTKEILQHLNKTHTSKTDIKSFQNLMNAQHPDSLEANQLISDLYKIKSEADQKGMEKLSTQQLNVLTFLYDLRPEVFKDLIKNLSNSAQSHIMDYINLSSTTLNKAVIQQMATLIGGFQGANDKLAVQKNLEALEDFEKLKDSKIMNDIQENFSSNKREKFSLNELENATIELNSAKQKLEIISRTLTTSLIDAKKAGDDAHSDKMQSIHNCLETIEGTIREIERQEEAIFEQQIKSSRLDIRQNFQQINNLMGSSPIPLEERIQLFNFLKFSEMAKDFSPILDLAVKIKAANQKKCEGTLSPADELKMQSEISQLDQAFLELFSKFYPKLNDQDRKILVAMNNFIPGFFKAKIGCINTQFTTDSMDFSLQIPKNGTFASLDTAGVSKTTGREIIGLYKAEVLAPHYRSEENEFAQDGFVKRDLYNLWNKNVWEPVRGDNGDLESVKWSCKFQIKQKDGSFKKVDSDPVVIDMKSLNLSKQDELAAWQIMTELARGENLKPVSKIDNIPASIRAYLNVPNEELVAKYNGLLSPAILSKGKAFKNDIETTYAKAMVDDLPPPSSKTSKFFKRMSLIGSSGQKRNSINASQSESLTNSRSSIKTGATSFILKGTPSDTSM